MFGIACTVFWKQLLSDFYATKLSILIWNPGELLACHYSMARYVLFLVNCDQIPCSEIQSLVLKQLPMVTPHNGSKQFHIFYPHSPSQKLSLSTITTLPYFSIIPVLLFHKISSQYHQQWCHKSKTSREENPLWKKDIAQGGKQAVHLYTCCHPVPSLCWISKQASSPQHRRWVLALHLYNFRQGDKFILLLKLNH